MTEIPSVPPQYVRVIPAKYVDGDLRKVPERREAAVQIAKLYHDDWQPMVAAAAAARHDNNLPVPVARMVLNWARTQPEWAGWLDQLEWDLLEDEGREAIVINLEEREQQRELRRREREEEEASHRRTQVRTKLTVKVNLLVASQNGKVIHRVHQNGQYTLSNWHMMKWGKWGSQEVWLDMPELEMWVATYCKGGSGFHNPVLHSPATMPDLPPCRSGCWYTEERVFMQELWEELTSAS